MISGKGHNEKTGTPYKIVPVSGHSCFSGICLGNRDYLSYIWKLELVTMFKNRPIARIVFLIFLFIAGATLSVFIGHTVEYIVEYFFP